MLLPCVGSLGLGGVIVTTPSMNNSGHTDACSGCLSYPLMLYGGAHHGPGRITSVRVVNSVGSTGIVLISSVISATNAVAGTTSLVVTGNTTSMHTMTARYVVSKPTSRHIRGSTLRRLIFASDVPCSGYYPGMGRVDVTSVLTRAVHEIRAGRSVDSRCLVWWQMWRGGCRGGNHCERSALVYYLQPFCSAWELVGVSGLLAVTTLTNLLASYNQRCYAVGNSIRGADSISAVCFTEVASNVFVPYSAIILGRKGFGAQVTYSSAVVTDCCFESQRGKRVCDGVFFVRPNRIALGVNVSDQTCNARGGSVCCRVASSTLAVRRRVRRVCRRVLSRSAANKFRPGRRTRRTLRRLSHLSARLLGRGLGGRVSGPMNCFLFVSYCGVLRTRRVVSLTKGISGRCEGGPALRCLIRSTREDLGISAKRSLSRLMLPTVSNNRLGLRRVVGTGGLALVSY